MILVKFEVVVITKNFIKNLEDQHLVFTTLIEANIRYLLAFLTFPVQHLSKIWTCRY